MEQRTDDWFNARLGNATASNIYKIMAKTKSGYGADRANYAAQLICERLTNRPSETFVNAAMLRGTELEPRARAAYTFEVADEVVETGYHPHPIIERSGASPDGLVGSIGLVEIKVPLPSTHISTLDGAPIDRKYLYQMMWQLSCTEREWCDFVSYCDTVPPEMELHVRRVERDDKLIKEIEYEVSMFLSEVDETVERLRKKYLEAGHAA